MQSCVNFVGVDVNTASPALLRYVSGLNQLTARRIYDHRQEHGPFPDRQALLAVSGIGEASFTQAAGFLKIPQGSEPLDATWIHPESYAATRALLARMEVDAATLNTPETSQKLREVSGTLDREELARQLKLGRIGAVGYSRCHRAARSGPPRGSRPADFRKDVVKLEDLEIGMELRGSVLNVVDFGAFVDVGLHDSGLVHVSQLANRFVRDPHDVVAVGDQIRVWVTSIDQDRRRVALTMIEPGTEQSPPERPRAKRSKKPKSTPRPAKPPRRPAERRGKLPPKPVRKKPKKPAAPITEAMAEGKEPMRTFGDLLQFYARKSEDDDGK